MEFSVKNFSVNFMNTISDCPSNIYTSVSEDGSFSEYSSDSDNMNIKPRKSQKKKKQQHTLVIDSDSESENETCSTGEDFTGVSGVTTEWNN